MSMKYLSAAVICTRVDEPLGREIAEALQRAGVTVFFPPDHAGIKIHRAYQQAVRDYDRTVLLVSLASLADLSVCGLVSEMGRREFEAGGETFIIPIEIDVLVRTIPTGHQCGGLAGLVPLQASMPREKLIARLLQALETT